MPAPTIPSRSPAAHPGSHDPIPFPSSPPRSLPVPAVPFRSVPFRAVPEAAVPAGGRGGAAGGAARPGPLRARSRPWPVPLPGTWCSFSTLAPGTVGLWRPRVIRPWLESRIIWSILSAQRVSSTFHARFCALSRTYIYRLLLGCAHRSQIPVFEQDLCWAPPGGPLDIPAMRAAAQLLLGTHDFSTFRSPRPEAAAQSPVRTLQLLQLQRGHGLLGQHHLHRGLEFWEVKVKSKSFLYRQVRRMVGALVAVGQGRLAPGQLQALLELRDPRALPPHATAPPQGLFLHSVEYGQRDLAPPSAPGEEELCGLSQKEFIT
ncbi:tRNA pseudouridine synthase-like 1 isoform X4 [Agelaius phoeniceus]|uniref:tRNA pseudouridine synthase-like 1 isoform X4 n=1 Tax=Agelaius phoeniceus TaxID=39638 RepID=UPI0040552C47